MCLAPHQRAVGRVQVGAGRRQGRTVLRALYQLGCLKARFPKAGGGGMEAVLINTSGGVADGDEVSVALEAGEGAALTVCTPSAERIYRAREGAAAARIDVRVVVGAGACLDYLPQETLLFDGCALDRRLRVDVHESGRFLGVEALVFGRALSGEVLRSARVRDGVALYRGGRLVLRDGVRLCGDVRAVLAARAGGGGAGAAASVFYAGPDAAGFVSPLRKVLEGAEAGVSVRDGVLVARVVAADGQALRACVVAALGCLRAEKPLPRLWAS